MIAPSFFGGVAYFTSGANGEEIHAINAITGQRLWARSRSDLRSTTPAADQNFVYHYGGAALEIMDRQTGAPVASVPDLNGSAGTGPGTNPPIIDSRGNVIVVSYKNPAPTVVERSKITSFNIAGRHLDWSSTYSYFTQPAVANGTIYAMRFVTTPTLDAIDEAGGSILWSWSPPASEGQTITLGNVVATKNLVFVSTRSDSGTGSNYLWAIDTSTRQAVWRYPAAAFSAVISANRTLYIVVNDPDVPGQSGARRIIAFKLQ